MLATDVGVSMEPIYVADKPTIYVADSQSVETTDIKK